MIYSMTGFGKAQFVFDQKNISLELKSLNSKSLDVSVRVPSYYKSKEIDIRKLIQENLLRGKIELSVQIENTEGNKQFSVNQAVVEKYSAELKAINPGISDSELLSIVMKLPEVLSNQQEELSEEEWSAFTENFKDLVRDFNSFRAEEGKSLEVEFQKNIATIDDCLQKTEPFLEERITRIKEKFEKSLKEVTLEHDEQRFHQELVFYIEKLDVTEERVRLEQHLKYFLETLETEEKGVGKKLGFIGQEIGREINTLGSKANHAEMQKLVVDMKESLEKIKEQTFNVL